MNRLISRTLSTTKSRLALIEKDAIIHVSWNTPSKKIGVAHSKYGEVIVKEVRAVENNLRVVQTHFIFEIIVEKSRIRHRTTLDFK